MDVNTLKRITLENRTVDKILNKILYNCRVAAGHGEAKTSYMFPATINQDTVSIIQDRLRNLGLEVEGRGSPLYIVIKWCDSV